MYAGNCYLLPHDKSWAPCITLFVSFCCFWSVVRKFPHWVMKIMVHIVSGAIMLDAGRGDFVAGEKFT